MEKRNIFKIVLAVLVVLTAIFSLWALEPSLKKPASAQEKSKWQVLLENSGIDNALWQKYLPHITRKEYQKVKKFLSNTFQKISGTSSSSGISPYFLHQNISTTIFWVGEDGSSDNHNISNVPSCWDDDWSKSFGGVDSPGKRNGYMPSGFAPKENPFYFALPYNDFNSNGNRKNGLAAYIPWFNQKSWSNNESACKNQWIRIEKNGKVAYAQWEDSGPFGENDINYVFGTSNPKSKTNEHAGLDVSPAVRDYLGLTDVDTTNWQFVDAKDVPDGPWKNIVTSSNVNWN